MFFYKLCYPVDSVDIGNVSSQIGNIIRNSSPFLQNVDYSKKAVLAQAPIFALSPNARHSNIYRLPSLISHINNFRLWTDKKCALIDSLALFLSMIPFLYF